MAHDVLLLYIIMIITIINWYQSGRLLKSSKYAYTTSEW